MADEFDSVAPKPNNRRRTAVMNGKYVATRLAFLVAALWLLATLIFLEAYVTSGPNRVSQKVVEYATLLAGDQADREQAIELLEKRHGLDRPIYVQYLLYLSKSATLNFGPSLSFYPSTIGELIGDRVAWSVGTLGFSLLASFLAFTSSGLVLALLFSFRQLGSARRMIVKLAPIPHLILAVPLMIGWFYILGWLMSSSNDFTISLIGSNLRSPIDVMRLVGFNYQTFVGFRPFIVVVVIGVTFTQLGLWILGLKGLSLIRGTRDFTTWPRRMGVASGITPGRFPMLGGSVARLALAFIACWWFIEGSILVEAAIWNPGLGSFYRQAERIGGHFMVISAEVVIGALVILATVGYDLVSAWVASRQVKSAAAHQAE